MKKAAPAITMLLISILSSGCGTFMMRVVGADGPRENLYPATQADVKMMKWCLDPDGTIITDKYYVGAGLCVVDMPVSIVFDTILLPIDGVQKHNYLKEKERLSIVQDINENTNSNQPSEVLCQPKN